MLSRSFESSAPKPAPYSLKMGSYSIPAIPAPLAAAPLDRHYEDSPSIVLLSSPHLLRGFCWAMAFEGIAAFFAYEAWRLWLLLR